MPRTARHIEPNGYYHVISRSVNEFWILKDDSDFHYFLNLEREAKKRFPLRLFHYALMNTHFHFVLQTPNTENLSRHLGWLKWHYTKWTRKKYGWKGPLWRERFKNLPIENEYYLAACGIYVEYNPVRAGICQHPADYPFTSYNQCHSLSDDLIDSYELPHRLDRTQGSQFQSPASKIIFSRAPAIGTPEFVHKYRLHRRPHACPQK